MKKIGLTHNTITFSGAALQKSVLASEYFFDKSGNRVKLREAVSVVNSPLLFYHGNV